MEIPLPQIVFEELKKGSRRQYDMLVAALKRNNSSIQDELQDELLAKVIQGVHENVVKLDRHHSSIAMEIMKVQWMGRGEGVVEAYSRLMMDLVSVHTGVYLHQCLRTILNNFKPSAISSEETDTFKHNHNLLASITAIVPKAILDLEHLLPLIFIHHNIDNHIQTVFVENVLQMSGYLPSLRRIIIKLTITLLTQHDARVPRDDLVQCLKEADEETKDVGTASTQEHGGRQKRVRVLDQLMTILFRHLHHTCFHNGVMDLGETRMMYRDLMDSFENLLLTPSRTSHTQFILFYLCSLHQSLEEEFLERLWSKVTSPSEEALYRQLSSLYLAGILCRAKYISLDTILRHLTRMRDWIEAYNDNTNHSHKPLQQQRHSAFYFVCQAFFYVIVSRHKFILESSAGHAFLMALYPQRIVFSRLNPLKYCLPSISEAFCAVVRNNQIAFCDTVLERNRRLTTSSSTTPTLLSYAPFEPYLLPSSKEFIVAIYNHHDSLHHHLDDSPLQPSTMSSHLTEDMDCLDLEDHSSSLSSPLLSLSSPFSSSPKHPLFFNKHILSTYHH